MKRDPKLAILYEDDLLVAIDKPAGLAAIPGRAEVDSAVERIGRQLNLPSSGSNDPRIRLVHRLDKETSGVLLFAKSIDAQRHLSHQFQNNTVGKEYLALVAGRPTERDGEIELAIAVDPYNKKKMAVVKHGRMAKTVWEVSQGYRHAALLAVYPKTGKTHQIRVHLKAIGHPLLVDPLYNPTAPGEGGVWLSEFKRGYRPKADIEERPLIDRLTLHAHRLSFVHPDGRRIELESVPPKDFRSAVAALSRFASA